MTKRHPVRIGGRLGADLTVLAKVTRHVTVDPVYLVWNHSTWCPMACKAFRSRRRARREALALSSLRHPNIVRCFGHLEPVYTLMEFLDGPTLQAYIAMQRHGRLSISDAIRVTIHIGAALEHMHSHGFLHLDVKPANIIIMHGRPVLFDFGSMREKGAARPDHVEGTDRYMSPEEAGMTEATEAADVFSLGVVFFEMLAGQRPFSDGTRRSPRPQLVRDPLPLRRFRPSVAPALEHIVHSCLERQPAERPPLQQLLPDLNKMITSGPRMWPADFKPDWRARRRALPSVPERSQAAVAAR
jgi:eukaryotic-like serine/threonine-protein kinase